MLIGKNNLNIKAFIENFCEPCLQSQSSEFIVEFCKYEATKNPKVESECKESCASFAVAAAWACGRISNTVIQVSCYGSVEF